MYVEYDDKPFLLLTVNCSISNKKNHMTEIELLNIFDKKVEEFTKIERYAVNAIQCDSDDFEIKDFKEKHNITEEKIKYVLSCDPYK